MSDSTPLTPGTEAPAASAASPVETDVVSPSVGAGARPASKATPANPLDRSSYGQALSRGYGDAMGRGLELCLVLVVFGGLGWLIDRLAGTSPVFTIAASVIGFAGITVKLWLGYDLEMRQHEGDAVWNRPTTGKVARNRAGNGPTDAPKQTVEL